MGYMSGFAECYVCEQPFFFNLERVPSVRDERGERQPVCAACMKRANERRAEMGLEPLVILPGAYEPEEVP